MNGNNAWMQHVEKVIEQSTKVEPKYKPDLKKILQNCATDQRIHLAFKMAIQINQLDTFLENLARLNRAELDKFFSDFISRCIKSFPDCLSLANEYALHSNKIQAPQTTTQRTNPPPLVAAAASPPPAEEIMTPLQKIQLLCQQYAFHQLRSKNGLHKILTDVMKWFHEMGLKNENQKLNTLFHQSDSPQRRNFNDIILCPKEFPNDKVIEVFWEKIRVLCSFKSIGATILQENFEKMKKKDAEIEALHHSQYASTPQEKQMIKDKLIEAKHQCHGSYVFVKFIFHDLIPAYEKDANSAQVSLNPQITVEKLRELQRLTHTVKRYALQNFSLLEKLDSFEAQLFDSSKQQQQQLSNSNTPTTNTISPTTLHTVPSTSSHIDTKMLQILVQYSPSLHLFEMRNPTSPLQHALRSARIALETIKKDPNFTSNSTIHLYNSHIEYFKQCYELAMCFDNLQRETSQMNGNFTSTTIRPTSSTSSSNTVSTTSSSNNNNKSTSTTSTSTINTASNSTNTTSTTSTNNITNTASNTNATPTGSRSEVIMVDEEEEDDFIDLNVDYE